MNKFKINKKIYALFLSFVLSFVSITQVNAMIPALDYCSTLSSITENNEITGGTASGAYSGYNDANCGQFGYSVTWIFGRIIISSVFE